MIVDPRRIAPRRATLILAVTLAAALAATPALAAYTVVDLGAFGVISGATGVASDESVVGYQLLGPAMPHATLFAHHQIIDLGTLGGDASLAQAAASGDRVVGWARLRDATRHAFLYQNGVMQDLGTLGGDMSQAFAINESGVVVGSSIPDHATLEQPFVWTPENGMQRLSVSSEYGGQALAINDRGVIVGYAIDETGLHAFRYENGVADRLGSLGGFADKAYGLNNRGVIVGYAITDDPLYPKFHPVAWDEDGIHDYHPLAGGHGVAYEINDAGTAVGFSYTAEDEQVAVRYEQGTAHDLNFELPPGSPWRLNVASGITQDGVISGSGTLDGVTHAFALVPDGAARGGWNLPAVSSMRAYPQPMRDAGAIDLTLNGEATGRLSLYDVGGRRVADLADGRFTRGTATFAVSANVLARLGSGVYFARFDGGGTSAMARVVIVK